MLNLGSHCHNHTDMFHLYDDIALNSDNFHILFRSFHHTYGHHMLNLTLTFLLRYAICFFIRIKIFFLPQIN